MPLADDVDLEPLASARRPGMVGRRPGQPGQRGGAAGRPPRARQGPDGRLHRLAREDPARRPARDHAEPRRIASAPPTTSPATRWSACSPPSADPVRKVSIIPRGMALGVTLSTPDADRVSYSREELEAKIKVALGGRVAEEVVYGKITTGAESDIQQLTQIARQMVGRWGMSEKLGPLTLLPSDGAGPLPAGRERDLAADPVADRPGGPATGRGTARRGDRTAHRATAPSSRASRRRCWPPRRSTAPAAYAAARRADAARRRASRAGGRPSAAPAEPALDGRRRATARKINPRKFRVRLHSRDL